jgi:hypothetical protein
LKSLLPLTATSPSPFLSLLLIVWIPK